MLNEDNKENIQSHDQKKKKKKKPEILTLTKVSNYILVNLS